ncbi:hypothetical protein MFLAVUS_000468 [Mucor flavus]|uniref:Cyclin N-terminal domain-containing protein n=1 Tax=Mucor flavus TaxID=439312 RepID=A0ABP9YJV2_9FUNG
MIATTYTPLLKSGIELSELCSSIIQTLCGGNITWDMDRQMNFSIFCNRMLMQIDVPEPVVYTSLKYFQYILINSVNEYNIIDLSNIAHEYSLFTVSLLLAYKFLEDNPPYMNQWSFVSMIPIKELISLESKVLNILGFSLNISTDQFYQWTDQCNTLYDMPYISLDQLNMFDLHMTRTTLGYSTLLPVLLDDIYVVGPSLSSTPTIQTSPILTSDYYWMEPTGYYPPLDQICCNSVDDFLLLNNNSYLATDDYYNIPSWQQTQLDTSWYLPQTIFS